jgi:UDP-N-acetylglucosamine 4,6-dehydratase/5-epimerase
VDLVLYAFQHGDAGDVFVQKAPAATIETLALAVKKVFRADNPLRIIGARQDEELYETLLTGEELARAEDVGDYFRVSADNRNLDDNSYFTAGQLRVSAMEDYNSHNVPRLDVDGMAELLLTLDCVREALPEQRKLRRAA